MADKKITVKSGDKITVEINRSADERREKFTGHLSAKGLIQSRHEDEYPARRLKKGGFINFYDLGYYAVEDYYEYFAQLINATFTANPDSSPNVEFPAGALTTAFEEIEEAIFERPLESFAASFYKIYKGSPDFERTIKVACAGVAENSLNNLPEWKDKGLQLSSEQVTTLVIKPLEYLYSADVLNLGTMENLKATATRDYEADPVEFVPSASMDVFLMPTLVVSQMFANYRNGLVDTGIFSDRIEQHDYLNWNIQSFPRELILDDLHDLIADLGSMDYYQQVYALSILSKNFDNVRAYRWIRTPSGGSYTSSGGWIDPEDVPFPAIYQPNAPNNSTNQYSVSFVGALSSASFALEAARLKAVIKKDGVFYYIWKTD